MTSNYSDTQNGKRKSYSFSPQQSSFISAYYIERQSFLKENPSFQTYEKQYYEKLFTVDYYQQRFHFIQALLKVKGDNLYTTCSDPEKRVKYDSVLQCENTVHETINKELHQIDFYYTKISNRPIECFKVKESVQQCIEETNRQLSQMKQQRANKWRDFSDVLFPNLK